MDSNAEHVDSFVGDNSETLLRKLEDGLVYFIGLHRVMFHGESLMRRVNELIAHFFEAGLYNFWITISKGKSKFFTRIKAIFHPLDGYYSFKLYHLHPAFYLLLIDWCLSALCFMIELLCNCVSNKINLNLIVSLLLRRLKLWWSLQSSWSPTKSQPVQLSNAEYLYIYDYNR